MKVKIILSEAEYDVLVTLLTSLLNQAQVDFKNAPLGSIEEDRVGVHISTLLQLLATMIAMAEWDKE